ncbi:MAG: hypothetical protein FJY97_08035 [candidate division Zixibacteria bacterium]|nr:hypothetical protein [candidate division Zixibacteria bacterium]
MDDGLGVTVAEVRVAVDEMLYVLDATTVGSFVVDTWSAYGPAVAGLITPGGFRNTTVTELPPAMFCLTFILNVCPLCCRFCAF